MKNNLLKIISVAAFMVIQIQSKAQNRMVEPGDMQAVERFYDERSHNSLLGAATGENDINPGGPSGSDFDYSGAVSSGLEGLNSLFRVVHDARDLYNGLPTLSANACSPDFSTNAGSMIPSSCPNVACTDCYIHAANELSFIRMQLGRLWCIYNNTKNFNTSAIAFGDNTSGIHAVTGLSWQYARAEIVESYKQFKETYDKKYLDMMGSLQRSLMQISACENEYGQPDWYQRFGFIYFEFMKDKYKRTD